MFYGEKIWLEKFMNCIFRFEFIYLLFIVIYYYLLFLLLGVLWREDLTREIHELYFQVSISLLFFIIIYYFIIIY